MSTYTFVIITILITVIYVFYTIHLIQMKKEYENSDDFGYVPYLCGSYLYIFLVFFVYAEILFIIARFTIY